MDNNNMDNHDLLNPAASDTRPVSAERAAVLGKWLWIYFWMQFAAVLPAILTAFVTMNEGDPFLVQLLIYMISAVEVVILFQLGREERRFRTCAILSLVSLSVGLVALLIRSEMLTDLWTLPSTIISYCTLYQFMYGCRDALLGVDDELAGKWAKLWKWYIGLLIAMIVVMIPSIILIITVESRAIAIVILIVLLALVVALLAVAVMQLVYHYRTAKLFRRIADALGNHGPELQ